MANQFIQQQKAELASMQRQRAQLAEKLGERHPEMLRIQSAIQTSQAKLDFEIAKVVQSVRTEYQAAQAQEQSLTSALQSQKGEALLMNRKAIDYGVLERDVESSKQIYQSLLQRAKETGVSGALKTSNIRVVDAAEVTTNAGQPATDAQPAGSGCSAACSVESWSRSSSSTWTTGSSRRKSSRRFSVSLRSVSIPKLTGEHAAQRPAHQQRRAGQLTRKRFAGSARM